MPIGGSSGGLSSAGPGAGGGAQGPQGATGSQGAQGHQGFQGNQGTQGSGGAQGSQGNQGTTGAQGPQGGTSGQDSRISVSASSQTTTGNNVTGLSVDGVAGTDLDLNADGINVDILTPGLYYAQAYIRSGTPATWGQVGTNGAGTSDPQDGPGGVSTVGTGTTNPAESAFRMIRVLTLPFQLNIYAEPPSGTGEAALLSPGMDVYRIA